MPVNDLEFWKSAAGYTGWALTGILGFLGRRLLLQQQEFRDEIKTIQKQVSDLKGSVVTRDEFTKTNDTNTAIREKNHNDNTDNFQRLDERITAAGDRHNEHAIAIERRLGEVLARIEQLRPPQRRQEGPERRSGY